MELLSEQVKEKHGAFEKVVRYWRGVHLNGVIVNGWTGLETREETTIIRPYERERFKVAETEGNKPPAKR